MIEINIVSAQMAISTVAARHAVPEGCKRRLTMDDENKNPEIPGSQPQDLVGAGLEPARPEPVTQAVETQTEIVATDPEAIAHIQEVKEPPEWKKYPVRGYLIAVAVSIVLLYVLNNLLNLYVPWIPGDYSRFFWNILNNVYNHVEISFLSKALTQCLWAINLSLAFSIIGNFVLVLYRPRWFHHLVQASLRGLAILATYVVYYIFPFKFESSAVNTAIRIVLIIIMIGLAAFMISSLVRSIGALVHHVQRPRNTSDISAATSI